MLATVKAGAAAAGQDGSSRWLHPVEKRRAPVRYSMPNYGCDEFLAALHFAPEVETLIRQNARRIGFA